VKSKQRKTGEQKFFKVKDAAAMLAIAEHRLIALIESGELLAVDVSGSPRRQHWRIPITAINRYQAAKKTKP
jgi:hypothetical protein